MNQWATQNLGFKLTILNQWATQDLGFTILKEWASKALRFKLTIWKHGRSESQMNRRRGLEA